jgi:hypothetical protein
MFAAKRIHTMQLDIGQMVETTQELDLYSHGTVIPVGTRAKVVKACNDKYYICKVLGKDVAVPNESSINITVAITYLQGVEM